MKRYFLGGITFLILVPCVMFVIVLGIAAAFVYFSVSGSLRDVELRNVQGILGNTVNVIRHNRASMENVCRGLNDTYAPFAATAATRDRANMRQDLERRTSGAGASGYIYTDLQGDVIVSSYIFDEGDESLRGAAEHARQVGVFSSSRVLDGILVDYSAGVVNNADGNPVGVVFVIGLISNHENARNVGRGQMGAETYVFVGDHCIASSEAGVDLKHIRLDTAIYDATVNRREQWVGVSEMFGQRNYIGALPSVAYDGKVSGVVLFVGESGQTDAILESTHFFMPVMLVVFIFLLSFLLFRVYYRITRPTRRLKESLGLIAGGDLTGKILIGKACSEITTLADGVRQMEDRIRSVLDPIRTSTQSLVNSANQMSTASENLADAANRQAASLEEVSSSMEQMESNIQQNTDNSVHANRLTGEVAQMMNRLSSSSKDSIEAINNIAHNISGINDLVSQTNILALNASVEAARAGEHGLGFGVVAKEVGRLAEQTHDTADNINRTAAASVSESEEAFRQVNELMPQVEKMTALIQEITSASLEQNQGVQQVNSAITELNRATQQNAASAEEIAASSAAMKEQIDHLNDAISVFKTDTGEALRGNWRGR